MQAIGGDAAQHFVEIFARFPLRHGQIHQPEVAAIARCGAGHLTLERNNEFESFDEQRHDLARREIAFQNQVIPRQATHGAPIDHAVGPNGMIAQEGRGEMFHGVNGIDVQGRFTVGRLHAHIEGGDDLVAHTVLATHIHPTVQREVVDGEGGYFLHVVAVSKSGGDAREESARDAKRAVGHRAPKILILFPMRFGSRRVADDPETQKASKFAKLFY